MKIFRPFPLRTSESLPIGEQALAKSFPSAQAPHHQHAQSPASSGPTKADEIVRLMTERRDRLKHPS